MTTFRSWLSRVLAHGESVLDEPPHLVPAERPAVLDELRSAFERHALDVAGPPIPFDPEVAAMAATALARACWLLVGDPEDGQIAIGLATEPSSPAAHLSADVTLRFLPAVYRRARLREPDGALASEVDRLLRRWSLSGVLADLDGEPATPPEFGGHDGLQLLYAERLVVTGRAGWLPQAGPAREWVERVFFERGKPLPASPAKETAGV